MVISSLADGLIRRADQVGDLLSGSMFEPTVRLGVTGLARAGKTVFITSLIANLIDRGRMPGLAAAQEGRIEAAFLQPQPDDTVPRFDYENHIAALTGAAPHWPESTRAVSELRLSLRVRPSGLLAGLQGPRTVHLDIVDYPGEWLLDLALLDKSYAAWSEDTLKRIAPRTEAAAFLALAGAEDATQPLDEPPLWREMERRFEVYKSRVVQPFFRDHFARIDRQVVLVDLLGALHRGPAAVADTRKVLAEILGAFRPGRNAFLSRLLRGRRVEKILFAATKADHLHHTQHPRLTALMETLVRDATERARFAGAETAALSLAALRATTEETRTHDGQELHMVRGRLLDSGKAAAFYPGELPESPSALFDSGRTGWLDESFEAMSFAPAALTLRPGEGPPHIRLDRAAQFLIGDRL